MKIIAREEAKEQELTRFYTGVACKHGHIVERYTKGGGCVLCDKIRTNKWKQDNPEKHQQRIKDWEINNVEQIKARRANYYKKNSDYIKKQAIIWQNNNPEKRYKYNKKYEKIHSDRICAARKKYRENNPDKIKETKARYYKKNVAKYVLYSNQYLQRRTQAIPVWYEEELVKRIYLKRDELSELWGIVLHVDHVVPLQGDMVCGLHCWDNLQILEAELNLSKGNTYEIQDR